MLNKEQIELAAKYFAVSNTGLIGCSVWEPTSKIEIQTNYDQVDGDYALEMGEGLDEELTSWKEKITQITSEDDRFYKLIKEKIPFIL